jgi:ATP-dependent protease HslVU (ClpYQ) peptidase subunit
MTTIIASKKDKKICIGADTLISYGDEARTFDSTHHCKLIKTHLGIFGFAGDAVVQNAFMLFIKGEKFKHPKDIKISLFILFCDFLKFLESNCGFDGKTSDSDFKLTSGFLFANKSGIWHVDAQRFVSEIHTFFAIGSGREYALGAAQVLYDSDIPARELVEKSLLSSCTFDLYSAEPLDIVEL